MFKNFIASIFVFSIMIPSLAHASNYDTNKPAYNPPPRNLTISAAPAPVINAGYGKSSVSMPENSNYKNSMGSATLGYTPDDADAFLEKAKANQGSYSPPEFFPSSEPAKTIEPQAYNTQDVYMSTGSSRSSSSILVK